MKKNAYSEEDLNAALDRLKKMTQNYERARYEEASKELALSLRHELARYVTLFPCLKESPSEHIRITNDLLNHCIRFQVNPESPLREITFDWSRKFQLLIYSNAQLVAGFPTTYDEHQLVLKGRTKEDFIECCMVDLGYERLRIAA